MSYKTMRFTPDQCLMRDAVLKLLNTSFPADRIDHCERHDEYPDDAYQALAAAGWLALPFEASYGGWNATYKDLAVFIEATAFHHPGVTSAFMTTVIYAAMYLRHFGTEAQKQTYLPGVIAGKIKMAVAYTEPDAGSDAAGIKTRARADGTGYVLSGQKIYITNAHVADYLIVTAKTSPEARQRGISQFIVPTNDPGVTIRPMNPMGRRTSLPNEVFFDEVRLPADSLIGRENGAWKMMMRALNLERLLLAAASSGQCLRIIDLARDWARQRETFGRSITEYQAISHKFSDMMIMTEGARLHTYAAAEALDDGEDALMETAIAKVVATENNLKVADLGVQIMGGAGYMDGPMSRLYRDARVGPIGGGTSEIMRNVIAKMMGCA